MRAKRWLSQPRFRTFILTKDDAAESFSKNMHAVIVPLAKSTFGAMQDNLHSFIAKTSTFAVKTNRYIPGVDDRHHGTRP